LKFLGVNHSVIDFEDKVYNKYGGNVSRGKIATHFLKSPIVHKISQTVMPLSTRTFIEEKVLKKKIPKQSKPTLRPEDRKILVNYFRPDVEKLEKLLGRKLPWSNFSTVK